ncbi:insecticidal delta-endotoxin Cry8Ea1 family protein, partial [Bacillus cereus]
MNQNYNHNEFEIMDTSNMGYQPRYPFAKAPRSELQNMDYKDWMNRCTSEESFSQGTSNSIRDAVIAGSKIAGTIIGAVFPPLKIPALILSNLIPFLWPKEAGPPGTPEAQFTWEQMMNAVEEMVDQKIDTLVKDQAISTLQILQSYIQDYQQALCNLQTDPNNEKYKEDVRREFNDAEDQAKAAIIQFRNVKYAGLLLADYAQAANLHLLLLRDVVQFGESWGFSALEVQQYYSNESLVGNPGMKQLLATYTDHCVRWYNEGLQNRYETGNWNTFNDFRRNMTLMILDIVAIWPTYDPILYTVPTKSQLTRTVYTPFIQGSLSIKPLTISVIENNVPAPPDLFRWLREIAFYAEGPVAPGSRVLSGQIQRYQYTLRDLLYEEAKGELVEQVGTLVVPHPTSEDDVWSLLMNYSKINYVPYPIMAGLNYLDFHLTKTVDQRITFLPDHVSRNETFGLPCGPNPANDCDPCAPCTVLPNVSDPCNDRSLYSHRFSYMGTYPAQYTYPGGQESDNESVCYGWTHVSADANNLIDAERITQIPAVKAYQTNGKVIKGPGSTGGDVVQLVSDTGQDLQKLRIRMKGQAQKGYQLRIRYASSVFYQSLTADRYVNIDGSWTTAGGSNFQLRPTYSGESLNYNSFGYATLFTSLYPTPYEDWEIVLTSNSIPPIIIDKIEFIPIEGSVEEFEANQALEKARKAVNTLFTGDAKNALKLNITDYAVDQAANLAECVSEEFHAQEKMILLDQVKFAKRLSHARNLLNHGDFESSDWSGENGWKTSPHVHVAADHPIFKGRYLHMPGATSSPFSSHVYPTYIYQKVDESKLKSYTRYLVRGFVGNSKDLELLVERYGKDVHVELDVPNDIQYSLPMNECGGFDRCRPVFYQARSSHACTCKDTASMHTDCQCKDKVNRTSADGYTNVLTGSMVYTNEFHAHKSCGCKNNDMYQSGTHPHKSCGCKDPHVFTYHIDTGCVDQEENVGLFFALKIASENGVANIDNLEIIEAQPLTGEALARVKKREQKWKQEMEQKRLQTEKAVQAAQGAIQPLFTNAQYNRLQFETL